MVRAARLGLPDLGVGAGLRVPHYAHVFEHRPAIDFFEIISENFMVAGGKPLYHLERALEIYPLILHGVSLNLGGPEPLDRDYLRRLKALVRRVDPPWLSDHLCWCGAGDAHLHDLLPLPYTEQVVQRVSERARQVQDFLELPFAVENTSSYLTYRESTWSEAEFVGEVVERADIGLMLDVNNVYVSAHNHGFDPHAYIRALPHERVIQIHLAGHTDRGTYLLDTHQGHISPEVWALYERTIALTGPVSTVIEWDEQIPEFSVLQAEVEQARLVRNRAIESRS